ncbi:hydantoinase/oxoprolinase family protein [Conexibacter sp. CPCC 206217]|uniref:hydantoinase/oxoprolinase family protein n=1 Tax=Conexibacter sp. CPCC 206217 TaxID=3064574 RepID=UPI0027156235|nr:hydantoinase/oxoprolinase family protein [Conexibacter sp. CPCC 206217]MDO8208801.1 hydantoinase/oxoprolinase family protein [Conexibacter sp. CPCC 206217]
MEQAAQADWRVGIDIGGTFTDVLLIGPARQLVALKVLSTPPHFETGVMNGLRAALEAVAQTPDRLAAITHGTTVATNAVLESDGAVTSLVTSDGFVDVLEIGRQRRPFLYDLLWEKPKPLVPRRRRFGVAARVEAADPEGGSTAPLELEPLVEQLRAAGSQAVAVCLINSYLQPELERSLAEQISALMPGVYVSASVDVSPEIREYERTSTVVVNSYVGPIVSTYVESMRRSLADAGAAAPLLIMQSSGGLMESSLAVQRPVQLIESGPAAGVVGVRDLARRKDLPLVVAFDMGGTTAKASLIERGEPFVAPDMEVGGGMNAPRGLSQGAGHLIRVPSIDIAEVGAGGGSIIRIDSGGALRVGPESASSDPGPACYGLGGREATLTDANVALGYLNPVAIAGGRVAIQPRLAERALAPLVQTSGLDALRLARGAYLVAVSTMTRAVRAVTSERGRDPRGATLVAIGGAGPLYAAELARALGIRRILVPVHSGVFSCVGLLAADVERQEVLPWGRRPIDATAIGDAFRRLEADAVAVLDDGGFATDRVRLQRLADMRYRGQRHSLRIGSETEAPTAALRQLRERFHDEHEQTYGRRAADELVELLNLRVRATIDGSADRVGAQLDEPVAKSSRLCFFDEGAGPVEALVGSRAALAAGRVEGPVIVEDSGSTTVVPPGAACWLDEERNIVIEWNDGEAA